MSAIYQFDEEYVKYILRQFRNKNISKSHRSQLSAITPIEQWRRNKGYEDSEEGYQKTLADIVPVAIARLRPEGKEPPPLTYEWQVYSAVYLFYIEKRPVHDVYYCLSMGRNTYYKRIREGHQRLVVVFNEMFSPPPLQSQPFPIFLVPRNDFPLMGRKELLDDLKSQLLNPSSSRVVLTGLPGVGKSAFVSELAYETEVIDDFSDGNLYVELGQEPDILSQLGLWARALGISFDELQAYQTIETRQQLLRTVIGSRRMLIVIDDVWSVKDAEAFVKVGGVNCKYILITRHKNMGGKWSGIQTSITVPELTVEDSLKLIEAMAPNAVKVNSNLDIIRQIVELVGGLSHALILLGNYLKQESDMSPPERLEDALDKLKEAKELVELLGIVEDETVSSLLALINVSYDALDKNAQAALRALSLFPPKPNTFSEEAALMVINGQRETLNALFDAGLLEYEKISQRYTLHRAIAACARLKCAPDEVAYVRYLSFFMDYLKRHQHDFKVLEPEITNISAALQIAYEQEMWQALLQGISIFYDFLERRGLYSQAQRHLEHAYDMAKKYQQKTAQASLQFKLGHLADRQGKHEKAKALFERGLALARQIEDSYLICSFLYGLGRLAWSHWGQYEQAVRYLFESLLLADKNGYEEFQLKLRINLGIVLRFLGDFDGAERYYRKALELAKFKKPYDSTQVLNNLGCLELRRERHEKAERYLEEGLQLARKHKYRSREGVLLQSLGQVKREKGNYVDAEAHFREALEIGQEIGYQWLICGTLSEWGLLHIQQGSAFDKQAEEKLKDALKLARQINNQEIEAEALFGLAQVDYARGECREARDNAEKSYQILLKMKHEKVHELKAWLDSCKCGGTI